MKQNVITATLLGLFLFCSVTTSSTTTQNQGKSHFQLKIREAKGKTSNIKRTETFQPLKLNSRKVMATNGTTLYGDVVYSDNWDSFKNYGIYTFPVENNTSLSSIYKDNNFQSNAGAIYANGLYHILNANFNSDNTFQSVSYFQYNANTWEENDENEFRDSRFMAADMTLDPLSNIIYGAFSDGENGQQLATFDFTSKGYVVKGALSKQLFAIAADAEGTLYGIGSDNILYKVDKTTAKLSKIGATGITAAAYLQSATFDWASGKLYWATTLTNDMAGLYEVDITSGKATLISSFPNNEEIIGLYSTNSLAADTAPSAVSNLTAHFSGTSTTGAISFTMPTTTNQGEALSGRLTYTIKVNGETVKDGNANVGEDVYAENITTKGGNTDIVVYASNATGNGMPTKTTVWTSYDVPTAPSNVYVTYTDGKAHITWNAPIVAVHGGYLDKENMTYTVTRYPDNIVVKKGIRETECSEEFSPTELAAYYYAITATNADQQSEEAKSNSFVAGESVIPPYYQPFDDATTFQLMTIIDANADGTKWNMSAENSYAEIRYADEPSDDWIITPQIKLSNDRLWKLSCSINTPWAPNWPEKIRISFGKASTVEAMTGTILEDTTFKSKELHSIEKYFKVNEDGNYNIGFHAGSNELYKIQLNNISIEAGPRFKAPAAVENLAVTADGTGKLVANISFKTPTKTIDGNSLTTIDKIEMYRDGLLIHTFNKPSTGTNLSFTDTQAQKAFNTYKVIAYNEHGFGDSESTKVYVGEDIPTAPTDIKVTAANGKGFITWEAPTIGENGGYIDSKNLVYGIKDNSGNILTEAAKGTSFQTNIETEGEQAYLMYAVFAGNSKGYSTSGISNAIIKGAAYKLPFSESFDNGKQAYFWGSTAPEDSYSSWSTKSGYARLDGGRKDSEARFFSGKIDISGTKNPVLEFNYWYRANSGNQPLYVDIISEGKDTTTIEKLQYTSYTYAKDFELVRIPISQFLGKKYIQVSFNCKSGDNYTLAAIDDIKIRDYYDYDLTASISTPETSNAGDDIEITAQIKNIGKKRATGYSINLYENNHLVATQEGKAIDADATEIYTFHHTAGTLKNELFYKVVVSYDLDYDNTNNESEELLTEISLPEYPSPESLSATASDNNIHLEWAPTNYQDFTLTTIDGAESYDNFADNEIGEWTILDKDELNTLSKIRVDTYPVSFPQLGQKMSFIVMNPEAADAHLTNFMGDPTGWQAASGKQYFASFGSDDGNNDDWLISPELNGEAQTISFSIHGYKKETYEVLYSTTDKETDNFVSLGSKKAIANTWTIDNIELPEGTRYFAIRNTSPQYSSYLFVDNITFKSAKDKGCLSLMGYNIYRDGNKLNSNPIATTSYTDTTVDTGNHLYQVTAVYNIGESAPATCEVNFATSIANIHSGKSCTIRSYGINGTRMKKQEKGIHIERMSDGTTFKIMMK